MDRIDIWVNVSNISYNELVSKMKGENSSIFRKKILNARKE